MRDFMSTLYRDWLFPWIEALATRGLDPERNRVLSPARGRILEIGVGSGHNIPHRPPSAEIYAAIEPSKGSLRLARKSLHEDREVFFVRGRGESLPFAAESFETVVSFLVLCSVQNVAAVLQEIDRVLRPGGRLLYFEHVRSSDPSVARWQERLTPFWQRIGGGCHLDRTTEREIAGAGFRLQNRQRYRSARMGLPITAEVIEGVARKTGSNRSAVFNAG